MSDRIMSVFVGVDHIDKVFNLPRGEKYIALKNIDLEIKKGEFVSLVGHSGCGKSTLLNIIAGLDQPTLGGVLLEDRQVTQPGPDRMVVFQNYSLLPWLTVRENIALGVNKVYKDSPKGERKGLVEQHIDMVHLRHAADKKPAELSGGMKQRVSIARALALKPKVLLLDEPFGALDALTRGNLQERLMKIAQESKVTCVMVTHDVDEALLLSDRVVLLTNGPEAHVGQILEIPIPRPRRRMEVIKHPSYYDLRNQVVYFLNQQKRVAKTRRSMRATGLAAQPEKANLDIGFIPLTDCAPLVVAKEKGFFEKHGLGNVRLMRESSWQSISEGITQGRLDASQMVAGMPLSMTIGVGNNAPVSVMTSLVLDRNGSAITLHKSFYDQGVKSLADLKEIIRQRGDRHLTLGIVHPASMHNLLLRYWLAAGGIDPDRDIDLTVVPPSEMLEALRAGQLDGYCVGEPWNSQAVQEGLGYVLATEQDIWPGHPEKVLGVRESWADRYPQTHLALVKALLEACAYCDDRRNREDILEILSQPQYVGSAIESMRPGFLGPYDRGAGEKPQTLQGYNQFSIGQANCPGRAEGLWILTQLARWGITPFPKNWIEILDKVRRVDVYGEAARQLGIPDFEPDRAEIRLFDEVVFTPDDPLHYLSQLSVCRPIQVKEILVENEAVAA
jgi:nitrate/nitrite transport system ATP-binding protein